MKEKFIFWQNFKEAADKLPDDLRLKFYDAITDYAFNGVEPDDTVVKALIAAIKPSLDHEEKRGGSREGAGRPKSKIIKILAWRSKSLLMLWSNTKNGEVC